MKKITFRLILLHTICFVLTTLSAQPANDDCGGAFEVLVGESEASAILTAGDSRGATASQTPVNVCSSSWYTDDTWYRFRTPVELPSNGITLKVYFNNSIRPTDVSAIGMAIYDYCDTATVALRCFSSDDPGENSFDLLDVCIQADHEYFVRIWSTGSDTSTEGTFRVGVFKKAPGETYLWWETFGGGIEANGWTTEGMCAIQDSNANAGWKYLPNGLIDGGGYIFAGAAINSPTVCDGAVGVDSDYNDYCNDFCNGPCPTPGHHVLTSPAIYTGDWHVAGLSVTWTQAIRQFQSIHLFAYRFRDSSNGWSDWTEQEINTEYEINGNFLDHEIQRFPLPGAADHDSIQLRFTYNDNYYLWAIDDVKILATECSNSMISRYHAIPPFALIPSNQAYPFPAMANVVNIGACPIENGLLNCSIRNDNSLDTIYNQNLVYQNIGPDSTVLNQIFPVLIDLPDFPGDYPGEYRMTYSFAQDSNDFDPIDNQVSVLFSTGGNTFGLEDGFTRSVAVTTVIYDKGAPLSYAYGNYFRPYKRTCADRIIWGVNNPGDMEGKTVLVQLLEWTDLNQNQIAEPNERKFIGFNDYTFTGNEDNNAIIETSLDNFESPGSPVMMQAGRGYIAIIEYHAASAEDPQLFLLASEARDYTGQQIASDSAYARGLIEKPSYFSVLGFSPDGDITNIDYEVKELDPSDDRIFFGNNIVPLVRVVTNEKGCIDGVEVLSTDEKISVFPNPASESIYVKMDFTKTYSGVQISLINSQGQRSLFRILNSSFPDRTEKFDTRDLAAGLYQLQVDTPEGQRTIPFVILH